MNPIPSHPRNSGIDAHPTAPESRDVSVRGFGSNARTLSPSPTVALVDDEAARRDSLHQSLELMNYTSTVFESPADLLAALQQGAWFDLLLLPLFTDGGRNQLIAIRSLTDVPVLFMVGRDDMKAMQEMNDVFSSFKEIDFILLPLDLRELKSRLQLLKNRIAAASTDEKVTWGDYHFCIGSHTVLLRRDPVHLKPLEFDLALQLFRNMGRLLERDWLSSALWGTCSTRPSRTLDVCASRIRVKLKLQAGNDFVLQAVYGRGYRLRMVAASQVEQHGQAPRPVPPAAAPWSS